MFIKKIQYNIVYVYLYAKQGMEQFIIIAKETYVRQYLLMKY